MNKKKLITIYISGKIYSKVKNLSNKRKGNGKYPQSIGGIIEEAIAKYLSENGRK